MPNEKISVEVYEARPHTNNIGTWLEHVDTVKRVPKFIPGCKWKYTRPHCYITYLGNQYSLEQNYRSYQIIVSKVAGRKKKFGITQL